MHRIQVSLTDDQDRALRDVARLRRSSISALIREGIDHVLEPDLADRSAALERARAVLGAFDSGCTDISERHDDYLADAFAGAEDRP
jgi:Arc/MetJ-type ribon-helix-helix transcriptional regulator